MLESTQTSNELRYGPRTNISDECPAEAVKSLQSTQIAPSDVDGGRDLSKDHCGWRDAERHFLFFCRSAGLSYNTSSMAFSSKRSRVADLHSRGPMVSFIL